MLEANKNALFERLFAVYNRNLIKRRFNSLNIKNLDNLKSRQKDVPLIIYANHSSWWDGLILYEILKSDSFDSFVLMEEKQLEKLKLFTRLGAFSIVRESGRDALQSLNYAVDILTKGKNKTLLIFPQGEILPNDLRPFKFFNGISYIVEKLELCSLIPCSLRIEFLQNFKPDIFIKFGEIKSINKSEIENRKEFTALLENRITTNTDRLKFDIIENKISDYQNIL